MEHPATQLIDASIVFYEGLNAIWLPQRGVSKTSLYWEWKALVILRFHSGLKEGSKSNDFERRWVESNFHNTPDFSKGQKEANLLNLQA